MSILADDLQFLETVEKVKRRKKTLDVGQTTTKELNYLARSMGNDIFPLPDCVDPARRDECSTSFKRFCECYFPNRFYLQWAESHLESLEIMQNAVLNGGGYYTLAEPRGSGKSSIVECLALWALLYGYRKFVVCIGATNPHAKELYQSILTEIETNIALIQDFPEACYPIWKLNGSYLRARAQHISGTQTKITVSADHLAFPYVEGSKTSGSIIQTASITGRIRGLRRTIAHTGEVIRPDFVIIDDPQTDRSAKSKMQVDMRERTIVGTILGLAGPGVEITAVMPCTVIRNDDLAQRFLDKDRRPEWQGKLTPMFYQFPTNMELWKEYAEIRTKDFQQKPKGDEATKFYIANRVAMDEGAKVSWTERYDQKKEISAIQHAMNLWLMDPKAFAAEYQNQPLIESNDEPGKVELNAKDIMMRVSGLPFGVCPRETEFVTTGVDIQQRILYYLTTAWIKDFGGVIVDYGTFPRQKEGYFIADNPPITLDDELPGLSLAPQVYKGLEFIRNHVVIYGFQRDETDQLVKCERALVDANWNLVTDAVYSFCKENETANLFKPAMGKGIGPSMLPMDSWPKKQGEHPGKNWRIRLSTGSNRGKHTLIDTNFWKSRVAERLLCPMGTSNALKLFGTKQYHHQLLADHLASEHSFQMTGRGRAVNEWKLQAGGRENHWWDCLVMSAVAASQLGLDLHEMTAFENGQITTKASPGKRRREMIDISKIGRK